MSESCANSHPRSPDAGLVSVAGDSLLALVTPRVELGQLSFANRLRRALHTDAPEVFARLDFEDDASFLEPIGFAHAAARPIALEDAELTWLRAARPEARPLELTATADQLGRIYLPGWGYVSALPAGQRVSLVRSDSSPVGYVASIGGAEIVSLNRFRLGEGLPTLLPLPVAALGHAVSAPGGRLPGLAQSSVLHRDALAKAFALIGASWPELLRAICRVVRHVVLFEDRARNSFATLAAHGIAFLNAAYGTGEVYFVEDLAHQCGHVIFSSVLEGVDVFTVPPDASVAELTGREDHRTLAVAMHGVFTQTLMIHALDRLLGSTAEFDREEAIGRLGFSIVRLGLDLRLLTSLALYTDQGAMLLKALLDSYITVAERHRRIVLSSDFSDQGYNFDYARYRAANLSPVTG